MTLRKFERLLKESPFTLRKLDYRAIKGINMLTALPLVREFTCSVDSGGAGKELIFG